MYWLPWYSSLNGRNKSSQNALLPPLCVTSFSPFSVSVSLTSFSSASTCLHRNLRYGPHPRQYASSTSPNRRRIELWCISDLVEGKDGFVKGWKQVNSQDSGIKANYIGDKPSQMARMFGHFVKTTFARGNRRSSR